MENLHGDNGKIRIMIAENQGIILHSLTSLIESFGDFEITGTASDGNELLKKLEVVKPDVILLDIKKPGLTSIEVTRIIDEKVPWVKVISLSRHNHPFFIKEMLKHGAKGFLSKNCTVDELREGIIRVNSGKTYFCSLCSRVMLRDYASEAVVGAVDFRNITPREIEIIGYLSDGYSTKEISDKMFISNKTVERHKSNLFKKMKLRNTAQLVKVAVENGLLIH
ncbi:MAG: response regulator transcription factor [Bacteroidales bacterium]|nr:response regulator transcription factor [Bacteroidales bacterium]